MNECNCGTGMPDYSLCNRGYCELPFNQSSCIFNPNTDEGNEEKQIAFSDSYSLISSLQIF